MHICFIFLAGAALLLGGAKPAEAAGEVLLTMDPAKKEPATVSETRTDRVIDIRSIDYSDPARKGESFVLVFEPGFKDQFEKGPHLTPGTERPQTGEWEFRSTTKLNGPECQYRPPASAAVHKCELVKIRLKHAPHAGSPGFLYRVEMAGKVLDPRLRGR